MDPTYAAEQIAYLTDQHRWIALRVLHDMSADAHQTAEERYAYAMLSFLLKGYIGC